MAKPPALKHLTAGLLLLAATLPAVAQQRPAVTVDQMLSFSPRHKDVQISTPTADEKATCKVEIVQDAKLGGSGYVLTDAKKQPVRRYLSVNGGKQYVWSYYRDGVEVYREIDANGNAKPDQFRWLNAAGMKWGVDASENGKVDAWRAISAEEVGQEAFQALVTADFDRLKALFITEAEMQALKLPATQVERLAKLQAGAAKKFADTVAALPGLSKATFLRVESALPNCVLGEHLGGDADLIKYASREILYEAAGEKEKRHDWLHTGELIQVGLAWRLVDVPSKDGPSVGPGGNVAVEKNGPINPKLQPLLEQLAKIDGTQQQTGPAYLKSRIAIVEQILPEDKAEMRETWTRQLFDNLSALAQSGDADASTRLAKMTQDVAAAQPGSNLAAYATYREMWTKYALVMNDDKTPQAKLAEFQGQWLDRLAKFVQTYPKADDTPEALNQLGIGTEFAGKADEAVRWYRQIADGFATHHLAAKAQGSIERLTLVGKTAADSKVLKLTGKTADGSNFDLAALKGKAVVVYYWASYCNQCVGDFAYLKKLHDARGVKDGIEIVCVNLDDKSEDAARYLKTTPVPGTHVIQALSGSEQLGLSGPLAVQYGINSLPTAFLVGRDGKVLNRALQVADLENELKKAQ